MPDFDDTETKMDFHNILVAPGLTLEKGQNPGEAAFEISDDGVPHNLRFEFMNLVYLIGASSVSYLDIKFLSLDIAEYGVNKITA